MGRIYFLYGWAANGFFQSALFAESISPWNFPLAIPCGAICAAFGGGNTVLLKPSNHTPVIAVGFARPCV